MCVRRDELPKVKLPGPIPAQTGSLQASRHSLRSESPPPTGALIPVSPISLYSGLRSSAAVVAESNKNRTPLMSGFTTVFVKRILADWPELPAARTISFSNM